MAQALYRKYRSKSLDEIVGQRHVTDVLKRALDADSISHAYLLTGPRGVGKTSIARILAHEINKLPYTDESEHLDIIEIDAASNNGVDDVRELRSKALVAPTQAAKKIYIIDEVHMLSKPAFNALLKILEEPPAHVVFILATTDLDKLPDTIVSRTQRYHFRVIPEDAVIAHLSNIAKTENIHIEEAALRVIARRGEGSLRDSVSLLDQAQHIQKTGEVLTANDLEVSLGLATSEELAELTTQLEHRDAQTIIHAIQTIQARGVSATTLSSQLLHDLTLLLPSHPEFVHVLGGLMEIPKSTHPETKMLVTLLSQVVDKPKYAAQATHVERKQAIVATPVKRQKTSPARSASIEMSPAQPKPAALAALPDTTSEPSQAATPASPADLSKFNWQAVLDYSQEHHSALYAILSKCTPDIQSDKVVLYAGRKFNKTKLDDTKYRPLLGQIFEAVGCGSGIEVEVLGMTAPPKDSQAARVAAMMGGGEEVNVE
ncbi:MAG: hypothetical protein UY35_C0001G0043 [Candidatus Saccharibacteria bacterium GW2011_GWC2_48_9]|nr:MAG: hypothetical protein UY35_C0001G0043 [Candidatus Saccharibacteria bacterium GW2011_GWC2_48_9]